MPEHPQYSPSIGQHGLVVIAASKGGMDALHVIVAALPADFAGAIAIVQHRTPKHDELLSELLRMWTTLDVRDARDGEAILPGRVFVAPADRHMTITRNNTIKLVAGPMLHHVLSSADPLFESAAKVYGPHVTAVVLTGGDGDGSTGVRTVKQYGGIVFAQDPATAECAEMPLSAIATGAVDRVLPLDEIAGALMERVRRPTGSPAEPPVVLP